MAFVQLFGEIKGEIKEEVGKIKGENKENFYFPNLIINFMKIIYYL